MLWNHQQHPLDKGLEVKIKVKRLFKDQLKSGFPTHFRFESKGVDIMIECKLKASGGVSQEIGDYISI